MRALAIAAAAAALAVVPAGAEGAGDAFPGRNGLIVFASDRTVPREPEIYAAALGGGAPRNLTRREGSDWGPLPSPDGRWFAVRRAPPPGAAGVRGLFVMRVDGTGRRRVAAGEEASWSPDSRSLAVGGDQGRIDVVDVATGAVRPLVEGVLPAWSPKGGLIAFLRGAQLHVVDAAGGEPRRLAPGITLSGVIAFPPAWSPDGTRLVFAGGEDDGNGISPSSQIHVVRAADGKVTRLTSGSGAKSTPAWSPGGSAIVFAEDDRKGAKSELVVVSADGGGRRLLTRNGRLTYDSNASWSPDGRWVAFTRGPADTVRLDVFIVRRDGTGLRRLTQPRSGVPPYDPPAWLPGSRTVLFSRGSSDLDHDLFVVRPDGGGVRRLTNNTVRDSDPAWSPDGSQVAFVRTLPFGRRGEQNEELFVMRADGTGVRRLTRHRSEDLMPAWSPDGSRIVFARRVRDALTALYTIRPDGSGLRRLTTAPAGFHSAPAWSPDGRRLAFTAGNGVGDGGELYLVAADGSRPRRLPPAAEYVFRPRWSPDGRRLVVTGMNSCGRACERSAIYVLRADGRRLRKFGAGSIGHAWSPDGRSLVVAAGPLQVVDARSGRSRVLVRGNAEHELPDWQPRCTRSGSGRGDRLDGGSGNDLLCGLGGDDRIGGGRGRDRLFGGPGADRIASRDGAFDVVGCGPDGDSVVADRRDLVGEDCERVVRGR